MQGMRRCPQTRPCHTFAYPSLPDPYNIGFAMPIIRQIQVSSDNSLSRLCYLTKRIIEHVKPAETVVAAIIFWFTVPYPYTSSSARSISSILGVVYRNTSRVRYRALDTLLAHA